MENEAKLLLVMPAEMKGRAKALAKEMDRPVSWVIRAALDQYLKEKGHA